MVAGEAQDPGRRAAVARPPCWSLAAGWLVPAAVPAAEVPEGRGAGSVGASAAGSLVSGPAQEPRGCQGRARRGRFLLRRVRDAPLQPWHPESRTVGTVALLAAVR